MGCIGPLDSCMVIHDCMGCKVDLNVSLVNRNLIGIPEYRRNFFQGQAICVREPNPHDDSTDGSGNDEAEVKLPVNLLECGRCALQPNDIHK